MGMACLGCCTSSSVPHPNRSHLCGILPCGMPMLHVSTARIWLRLRINRGNIAITHPQKKRANIGTRVGRAWMPSVILLRAQCFFYLLEMLFLRTDSKKTKGKKSNLNLEFVLNIFIFYSFKQQKLRVLKKERKTILVCQATSGFNLDRDCIV